MLDFEQGKGLVTHIGFVSSGMAFRNRKYIKLIKRSLHEVTFEFFDPRLCAATVPIKSKFDGPKLLQQILLKRLKWCL
jgi:hypothetical protein